MEGSSAQNPGILGAPERAKNGQVKVTSNVKYVTLFCVGALKARSGLSGKVLRESERAAGRHGETTGLTVERNRPGPPA